MLGHTCNTFTCFSIGLNRNTLSNGLGFIVGSIHTKMAFSRNPNPGAVDTPSLRRALGKAGSANDAAAVIKSIAERSPLGRIGEASEIGKVAVFLARDASSYLHRVELFADGGLTQV
jgi:hypothetical protein